MKNTVITIGLFFGIIIGAWLLADYLAYRQAIDYGTTKFDGIFKTPKP